MKDKKKHSEEKIEKVDAEETASAETVSEESLDEKELNKVKEEREASKEEEYKKKIDDLNDRLMRQMAEFDNFRKRTEKEKQAMFDMGAKNVVDKLLPIIDNFERGLASLSDEEKGEYLESLGLSESGLDKIVRASYSLLGLMSYLTAGEKETRAWTIKKGTKAPQAAGKIHTDFERGFIKAEVVNYKDLLDNGSLSAAREKGLVRMEGKEYVMQDGDVVLFRFNV